MEAAHLEQLATLRIVVGYLGEHDHYAWWQSAFFASSSLAFLQPVFARTQLVAQCHGVTRAAALLHDERIGVGNVYHLFRLPEDLEQALHRTLHAQELSQRISMVCASKEAALDYLRKEAGRRDSTGMGPTRVGTASELRNGEPWRIVAALYLHACGEGAEVFPYFANQT